MTRTGIVVWSFPSSGDGGKQWQIVSSDWKGRFNFEGETAL